MTTRRLGTSNLRVSRLCLGTMMFGDATAIDEAGIYMIQRLDRGPFGFEGGLRYDRHTVTATPIGDITERMKATSDGEKAAAVELALEGLYLARRISKDPDDDGQTVYS